MRGPARQLKIREMLEAQGFVDLATLCEVLDTSESTVRREMRVAKAWLRRTLDENSR